MLAALVPYFQANYMGSGYEDMRMGFAQGAGAMMMDGVWSAKYLTQSLNPNLKFSVFPCPPLTASGKPGVFTYVDGSYGGNVKTKYPDKVIAFLKFAATKDFGQMFSTFTGEITAVPGVSLAMSDKPILKDVLDYVSKYAVKQPWSIVSPFDFGNPSIKTLFDTKLQSLISGGVTAEALAADIQTQIAQWYPPFQKK
jgi:raffinose/stachyose/melibiose transport system substrate-binding protein